MDEMIKKLEERRTALIKQSNESKDLAEVREIQKQLETLNEDLGQLRDLREKQQRAADLPKFIPGQGFIPAENRNATGFNSELDKREKAGNDLKDKLAVKSPFSIFGELRAVTVNPPTGQAASIVVPQLSSANINPDFPVVSSLIDAVSHLSLHGGKSFEQPYITGIDTGNYTSEGANAAQAETHFDYAVINQTKITASAEITEELEKLPAAPYADVVFQNIRTSIRRLVTKEILVGAGGTNQLVGIFSNAATAIDPATDYSISQITDTTLDEILYRYGGEEEVEDPAVLILNKMDLLAFAKVRTSTKQKFYDIKFDGRGGTISGVPFIINSACKPLMSTGSNAAEAGDYCMAYGSLSGYQLVEFSELTVKRSDDAKFTQGMAVFRGVAWYGGNVTRKNAFLRVKKAAS